MVGGGAQTTNYRRREKLCYILIGTFHALLKYFLHIQILVVSWAMLYCRCESSLFFKDYD